MQINGGKNDKFVAYADAGGLVMGYYDGSKLPMWDVAKRYVLADNFFQGTFGGSFLNHFQLVCGCIPVYPNADKSPAKGIIAAVDADGVSLTLASKSPKSALEGAPKFLNDGKISPDFYAVNTMQPPYQPSSNHAGESRRSRSTRIRACRSRCRRSTTATIGDLLSLKGDDLGLVRRRLGRMR